MSSNARRRPWEVPDCPDCDGHLFVGRAPTHTQLGTGEWYCYNCGRHFDDATPDPEIEGDEQAAQAFLDGVRAGLVTDGGAPNKASSDIRFMSPTGGHE